MPDGRNPAGQDRCGSLLDTSSANFFGETGNSAVGDFEGSFGSGIARTKPGAAGGQEYIDGTGIRDSENLSTDISRIIGAVERGNDGPPEFLTTCRQSGAGQVLALPARDGVADGENSDFQVNGSKF